MRTPQKGDVYAFRGICAADDDGRGVKVHSISMTGRLHVQAVFMGVVGKGLQEVNFSDALAMIAQGVWELTL